MQTPRLSSVRNPLATIDTRTPTQFYFGASRRQVLKELWFGLSAGEVGFLTGKLGLGKTLLCRELLRRLPAAIRNAYVVVPKTEQTLMDNIFQSVAIIRQVARYLDADQVPARPPSHFAIVIDEAQRLGLPTIQRLAEWRAREAAAGRSIGLLFVGPPEFERTLELAELHKFDARVTIRCDLPAFPREDTEAYIDHWQKHQRGTGPRLNFSDSASRVVHLATGGIPGQINKVCGHALDAARLRDEPAVTALGAMRAVWYASMFHRDAEFEPEEFDSSPTTENRHINVTTYAYPRTVRVADLGKP